VVVASLERDGADGSEPISQAFRFPAGRPLRQQPPDELGLSGSLRRLGDGSLALALSSRRLAYGVRIHTPGFSSSDDALTLEPGVARCVALRPDRADGGAANGSLTALNMRGSVRMAAPESSDQ
jgi:hypothetical protein